MLLVSALALVAFGIAMVFSASIPSAAAQQGKDLYCYLKRELLFASLALALMWCASRVPMRWVRRHGWGLLLLAAVLLVLVLAVGEKINGAQRWLRIPGTGFRFQPSELAKLALVLVSAAYFARFRQGLANWRAALFPCALLGAIAGLIAIEPDLGTALVTVSAMLVYFHIAGAKLRQVVAAGLLALAFGALLVWRHPYQWNRILGYLHGSKLKQSSAYQTDQSLMALGSGGLAGYGYCDGVEKYFYLPAVLTDSILAVIGEELGLVGTWSVLALFACLLWRGMAIAARARDRFSALVATGITCLLGTQALVNMAVVTGSVPTTGVPLPFVSYGGSSLIFSLLGVGLLLNVSRRCRRRPLGAEAQ